MLNYGIGGQERKFAVNEAIAEIPQNRTLFLQKLNGEPPMSPVVTHGLQTVEQVFEHFKPSIEVDFETEEGTVRNETLHFRKVGHFGKQGITDQSNYLQELNAQVQDHEQFVRQLKANKVLKTVLENPEAKRAYLAALQTLIDELEQTV